MQWIIDRLVEAIAFLVLVGIFSLLAYGLGVITGGF